MTKQEIRQRILRALNDDPVTPVFWTAAEIDESIQDGMDMLAETSEALKRTFHVPLRDGIMVYTLAELDSQVMAPYRIWLPELRRRLHAWSLTMLDARHEQWMTITGDPWVWWPVDWRSFGIWPVPATGGGWLEVDCLVWPETLLNDIDRPEFPPADHEALVLWGEIEGRLKQHQTAEAMDLTTAFIKRWGRADQRASVEQMQAAFHERERSTGADDIS